MPTISRKVISQIETLARRTAQQVNPIVEGVVIARNPDGTLIVSDGRGGCLRQAPKANVRIGEKIKVGLEPALGQQTSLPEVDLTLDPSTVPCPDDPRGCIDHVGADCVITTTEVTSGSGSAVLNGTVFSIGWIDTDPGTPSPGADGSWQNRLGAGNVFAGGPQQGYLYTDSAKAANCQATRRSASYANNLGYPWADKINLGAIRHFMAFDTSVIPSGITLTAVMLRLKIKGNTSARTRSDRSMSIVIVPSSHDNNGAHTYNWPLVDHVSLATSTIADIIAAGPGPPADTPYDWEMNLDAAAMQSVVVPGGTTKLAVLLSDDFDIGLVTPTVPASFTSPGSPTDTHELDDWVLFNGGTDVELFLDWTTTTVVETSRTLD